MHRQPNWYSAKVLQATFSASIIALNPRLQIGKYVALVRLKNLGQTYLDAVVNFCVHIGVRRCIGSPIGTQQRCFGGLFQHQLGLWHRCHAGHFCLRRGDRRSLEPRPADTLAKNLGQTYQDAVVNFCVHIGVRRCIGSPIGTQQRCFGGLFQHQLGLWHRCHAGHFCLWRGDRRPLEPRGHAGHGDRQGTIPILRQQKDWVGGCFQKKAFFAHVQYCIYADIVVGWVGGSEKVQKCADVIQGWSSSNFTGKKFQSTFWRNTLEPLRQPQWSMDSITVCDTTFFSFLIKMSVMYYI